jgi:hypothetical protein
MKGILNNYICYYYYPNYFYYYYYCSFKNLKFNSWYGHNDAYAEHFSQDSINALINQKLFHTDPEGSKIAYVDMSRLYQYKELGLFATTDIPAGQILFNLNGDYKLKVNQSQPQDNMIVADILLYTPKVISGDVSTIMLDMSKFYSCCAKYIKGDAGKIVPNVVLQYTKTASNGIVFQIVSIRDIKKGN